MSAWKKWILRRRYREGFNVILAVVSVCGVILWPKDFAKRKLSPLVISWMFLSCMHDSMQKFTVGCLMCKMGLAAASIHCIQTLQLSIEALLLAKMLLLVKAARFIVFGAICSGVSSCSNSISCHCYSCCMGLCGWKQADQFLIAIFYLCCAVSAHIVVQQVCTASRLLTSLFFIQNKILIVFLL